MPVFRAAHGENNQKSCKKRGAKNKFYCVSERAEDRLSSHAFISISRFLTKTNFFEGEGGLKLDFDNHYAISGPFNLLLW